MSKLEELQPNAAVRGILPDALVTVVGVQWFGSEALELTYKTPAGKVANELLYRHDQTRMDGDCRTRPAVEFRRRRRPLPPRLRRPAHSAGPFLRSGAGGSHLA